MSALNMYRALGVARFALADLHRMVLVYDGGDTLIRALSEGVLFYILHGK